MTTRDDPVSINPTGSATTSGRILQLNFKFSVTAADHDGAVSGLNDQFAAVPGLRWKIWMINAAEGEAGGIYHFDGEAALNTMPASRLAAQVTGHPALSDFSVKQFDVMEKVTAITRGPV